MIDRIRDGSLTATCVALVADSRERECVPKADAAGIPVVIVERAKGEDREAYDRRLDAAIRNLGQVDIIAAMGWMWILSPWFVAEWHNRILNVHPALLPRHPGAHGIEDALAAGDSESGMTIHCIDEGVDTGPILVQKSCSIESGETVDSLKAKVQALEREWYPRTLQMLETGELRLP